MNDNAAFVAKIERSAGYFIHDFLPPGSVNPERVICSALPAIVLRNAAISATQGPVVVIDPDLNTTVCADVIYVVDEIRMHGTNIKIVARKIIFSGQAASIVTDGEKGGQNFSLLATPKRKRAQDGVNAVYTSPREAQYDPLVLYNQVAGEASPGEDGQPGSGGGAGTPAGNIEIYADKLVGKYLLSACGGDGGDGQDGQDGQDGGNGGDGTEGSYSEPAQPPMNPQVFRTVLPPTLGAHGGDSGHGGLGGGGGHGGTVRLFAMQAVSEECKECSGTSNCRDCDKCAQNASQDMRSLATLKAEGGQRGADGKDGSPGQGGLAGATVDSTLKKPIQVTISQRGAENVHDGGSIVLRSDELKLGDKQIFGVYWNGCYYAIDDPSDDRQLWDIYLVHPSEDHKIRFGDEVRLRNRSYSTELMTDSSNLLNVGTGEPWLLESPNTQDNRCVIKHGNRVYLRRGGDHLKDHEYVSAATDSHWLPWKVNVARDPKARLRSFAGIIKPRSGKSEAGVTTPVTVDHISGSEMCLNWMPAQMWLQAERLKGEYLTINLGNNEIKQFGDELLRWNNLLAPLTGAETKKGMQSETWQELYGASTEVGRMLGAFSQGYDYFGNMLDYAPNLSFAYYASELDSELARLLAFEEAYDKLYDKATTTDSFLLAAAAAFNEAEAAAIEAERRLPDAIERVKSAQQRMQTSITLVDDLKDPFRNGNTHSEAFRREIAGAGFSCNLDKLLQGIEMMVFAPPIETLQNGALALSGAGAVMAGVQLAGFIKEGLENPTITDAFGDTLERKQVLTTIRTLDGELFKSAQDVFAEVSGEVYEFSGPVILATLDQWDSLVREFINLESAKLLQADIRALADAVRVRGDSITEFNSKLREMLFLAKLIETSRKERRDQLKKAATLNDASLPLALSFLSRHHQLRKDASIELVYLANRAYANWILDDGTARIPSKDNSTHGTNVFREVILAKDPWRTGNGDLYGLIDHTVLETCYNLLREWFRDDISSHFSRPQLFGASDLAGLRIRISDEAILGQFRKLRKHGLRDVHKTSITISIHGKDGTFTNSHLAGMSNVRLSIFRVFLIGAYREALTQGDELIQMQFIHDSRDLYYTEDGELRTFTRQHLEPKTFIYNGAKGVQRYALDGNNVPTLKFVDGYFQSHADGQIGPMQQPDLLNGIDDVYAGVGPFTTWTIIADPDLNPRLNLDNLKEIELQLVGYARTSNKR